MSVLWTLVTVALILGVSFALTWLILPRGLFDFSLRDEDRDHCTFCREPPKWLCVGFMAPAVTACDRCLERLRGVPMMVGPLPDKQN